MKSIKYIIVGVILAVLGYFGYQFFVTYFHENKILKQVITRLEADSRVAEVLVTGVNFDEQKNKMFTKIKFLEYDVDGKPLEPRYYTFSGNIIQFQSLVIRFDDIHIRGGDKLKGKSAFLFWKVFMLDGENTQEYEINKINAVPQGYKVIEANSDYEAYLWRHFWQFALSPDKLQQGIKSAQIEAPGTMFIPGILYTIKIEHDGGLRIDSNPISTILRGETLP